MIPATSTNTPIAASTPEPIQLAVLLFPDAVNPIENRIKPIAINMTPAPMAP